MTDLAEGKLQHLLASHAGALIEDAIATWIPNFLLSKQILACKSQECL